MTEIPPTDTAAPTAPDAPPQLDAATFDLDAWIDGVKPLRQVVTLYQRADLMPRIDDLVDQIQNLKPDDEANHDHDLGDLPPREKLRRDLKDVWDQYEASGVEFDLEQVSATDLEALTRQVPEEFPMPPGAEGDVAETINMKRNDRMGELILNASLLGVGPAGTDKVKATPEQIKRLASKFGITEFGRLVEAAQALTFSGQVSAPFSQRVSAILTEAQSG